MLTGSGYSFSLGTRSDDKKKRVDWGRMSMFVPPMQWWHRTQSWPGNGPLPRSQTLGIQTQKSKILKDTGEDVKKGGAQIEYEEPGPRDSQDLQ